MLPIYVYTQVDHGEAVPDGLLGQLPATCIPLKYWWIDERWYDGVPDRAAAEHAAAAHPVLLTAGRPTHGTLLPAARCSGSFPTLLIIVSLSFLVIRLAPGRPFASERALPPEVLRDLEAKYGFDRPMLEQLRHLSREPAARFDLGLSTKYPQMSVSTRSSPIGFPVTLQLAAVALVWALLIGVNAGIIGALRQNTGWDHGAMALAMIGISLPTFVLGPLLILRLLADALSGFPPARWGDLRHIILPGITLGTVYAAYIARLTRGGMLEVVRADFVRTARAKGLSELRHHLAPHAARRSAAGGDLPRARPSPT